VLAWTNQRTSVTLPAAYARLVGINVDVIAQTVDLSVGIYADEAARVKGAAPDDVYHAWPDFAAMLGLPVDVRAASYAMLKTLPAFAGATDAP
jgi:hypothetical protein